MSRSTAEFYQGHIAQGAKTRFVLIADQHRWRNAALLFAKKNEQQQKSKTSVFSIESIIECVYVRKEGEEVNI